MSSAGRERAASGDPPRAELTTYQLQTLPRTVARASQPLRVITHVRTGPITPHGTGWDVGHFVLLCAPDPHLGEVMVADTYTELGARMPPGPRRVPLGDLADALTAPPGRGLLILTRPAARDATQRLVPDAGVATGVWDT